MRESDLRRRVVALLKPLHAVPVENAARFGTPDINYIEGWLELKYVPNWPRRWDTPVRVPSFKPMQRVWIARRSELGGRVHVLLRVENEWLLLPPLWAVENLGQATRPSLRSAAIGRWERKLEAHQLIDKMLR